MSVCVCLCLIDPPRITSLTVDDHEVNGDYLIQKDQEVIVACIFDKGNPPVPVRLLDKHGKHFSSSKDNGQVSFSVVVRCEDEWPMVLCKSDDSEYKRFVSFLVRCKKNHSLNTFSRTHNVFMRKTKDKRTGVYQKTQSTEISLKLKIKKKLSSFCELSIGFLFAISLLVI